MFSDVVSHKENQLILKLNNGQKKILTDIQETQEIDANTVAYYNYQFYLPNAGFHIVRVSLYEGGYDMFVNAQTGETTPIIGFLFDGITFSPDNKQFLSYNQDESGFSESGIQIWEISHGKLQLKYEDNHIGWEPEGRWLSNQDIAFTNNFPPKWEEKQHFSLKLLNGNWVRVESNIEGLYKGTPIASPDGTRIIANNIGINNDAQIAIYRILDPNSNPIQYIREDVLNSGKGSEISWENNNRIAVRHHNIEVPYIRGNELNEFFDKLNSIDFSINFENEVWKKRYKELPKNAVSSPNSKNFLAVTPHIEDPRLDKMVMKGLSIYKLVSNETEEPEYQIEFNSRSYGVLSGEWKDDNNVEVCYKSADPAKDKTCQETKYNDSNWN
jgi:hypothetical protein